MTSTAYKLWSDSWSFLLRKPKSNIEVTESELALTNGTSLIWDKAAERLGSSHEEILQGYSAMPVDLAVAHLQSDEYGLSKEEVDARTNLVGPNILSTKKPLAWWQILLSILPNPFNVLLVVIAVISIAAPPPQWSTFTLLIIMVVLSCGVRFWQEYKSSIAAIKLQNSVTTNVRVRRQVQGTSTEEVVNEKTLVPGDVLFVDPGDAIPADCLLLEAHNLSISQSSLTGESEPQRKSAIVAVDKTSNELFDLENIILMGTSAISGSGLALVLRTGDNAFLATIMKQLNKKRPLNSFQRGIRNVSFMMIGFMIIMVPIVLGISGKVTGNWQQAALFAVSVAVGLVPEMLPAIVNANLARGAFVLAKKDAIVKRLDAIQNVGGMSVLCSDKTGTLTMDEITLRHHLDPFENVDQEVFSLGYINAFHQSGKENSIDHAIISHALADDKLNTGEKFGEIPFTFESRRSSCIIKADNGALKLICKGAFEEVLSLCSRVRLHGQVLHLDDERRKAMSKIAGEFNNDGYRVILVATRTISAFQIEDEDGIPLLDVNMIAEGFLTFLDPPKPDAKESIARLKELGVDVRVLTGDNLAVAMKACRSLELFKHGEVDEDNVHAITGSDLARLEGDEYDKVVKRCKIFAKLTPSQKGEVIMSLKKQDNVVGMLGDGINDCVALRFADVGISVDTGANVAKECADVILTRKELSIICEAVIIGRLTYGNTIKYIKMVASSNFGNVFSILIASCWLPYDPMTALQLLIQNLLYDFSQGAIPWDHMDPEFLANPQRWKVKDILKFILILGPTSSTIDMMTFCLDWFFYGVRSKGDAELIKLAHTHWFLEGLLTQTIIVHLLRTAKVPLFQSNASKALLISTMCIGAIGVSLPFIPPLAHAFGFVRPKNTFLGFLAAEILFYCVEVQAVKMIYIKLFKSWL
ncbi:related to PMR1-Ca++-transporting P-type ATPase located in Golgi [Phialocephala subalpina]|uniref:Magnesium-transporting ATPase, P-type 1 n=1 Tax=Phialocephala subalpina TaxID=576137 RepID=A0A1L7WQ26_9HELO|nr:related to PMR1-Ca++-transporting P-type ATPase located in Golgi [Phialocephala subalpina]